MPKIPRALEAAKDPRHGANSHNSPVAIWQVGNRPPRPIPKSTRPSKTLDCGNPLLHKVGGGGNPNINHCKPMQKVCVEQHHHQVPNPKDHNIRQWDPVHGQEVQRIPRRIPNPPIMLIRRTPTSQRPS
ncbi:hypothetical protein PIB30_093932 [Stylosanthes scabra]|uniref:Uncharacterized protein n=1 Tax=Stylosanthes scabra TaxID=79078 RepID=A0ABU6WTK2_9FABA|nr:hypothetical protein [Stylosanthes scabra]